MSRPLLITDCDEVLLHMVSHFDAWLGEAHGIRFAFETGNFGEAMTETATGELVAQDRVWPLLKEFFCREMHRQTVVPGAVEALGRIG
ncbi:MAG TPA: HAD family hydrolase, partial [Sphingomicrobium sp.]|nr:HAD family hydrolase [Sphingomicrobium sp.]